MQGGVREEKESVEREREGGECILHAAGVKHRD